MLQTNTRVFINIDNDENNILAQPIRGIGLIHSAHLNNKFTVKLDPAINSAVELAQPVETELRRFNSTHNDDGYIYYTYKYMNITVENIVYKMKPCVEGCKECKNHIFHDFLDIWKEDWSLLVPRKVNTVKLKSHDILHYEYTYLDKEYSCEESMFVDNLDDVPDEWFDTIVAHYRRFYGFTSKRKLIDDDRHDDQVVYFNKDKYNEIDFDVNMTGTFGKTDIHKRDVLPPETDDIIMGIVSYREDTGQCHYNKWFIASPQFFDLWCLVTGKKKLSMNNAELIPTLETRPWAAILDDLSLPYDKRRDAVSQIYRRFERYYTDWPHIYPALGYLYIGDFDNCFRCIIPSKLIGTFLNKLTVRVCERRRRN